MTLVRYLLTTLAESFIILNGIPSGPIVLFTLSDLTISFISSLEGGSKSKLKDFGKKFYFYGYNTGMVFINFNVFLL